MNSPLQRLLQHPDVWRSRDRRSLGAIGGTGVATGFSALDRALHSSGWPRAALTELLLGHNGIGELRLLAPLLARLAQQQLWQLWINPPFIPYAPALQQYGIDTAQLIIVRADARQQLWACEQALRSAACGAVLYWPGAALRYGELRKLQVAAGAQQCVGFLLRDMRSAQQPSPAALRLQLNADDTHLRIHVLKQRGGNAGQRVAIEQPAALHGQLALHERPAVGSTTHPTESIHPQLRDPLFVDNPRPTADGALQVVTWQ